MSIILNIDTSANAGMVSISRDGMILGHSENINQSEHASFLQPAIKDLLVEVGISRKEIDAVSVANGPGSYTGLRIGLASAKGICYALDKPLITINSLLLMAKAMKNEWTSDQNEALFCPMIDARRMEVFTAVYNQDLKEIISPSAMVVNGESFGEILMHQKILFFGNGAVKVQGLIGSPNALFMNEANPLHALAELAHNNYKNKIFSNLAYCEPFYLKEFFNG